MKDAKIYWDRFIIKTIEELPKEDIIYGITDDFIEETDSSWSVIVEFIIPPIESKNFIDECCIDFYVHWGPKHLLTKGKVINFIMLANYEGIENKKAIAKIVID